VDLPRSDFSTAILFLQVNRVYVGTPLANFGRERTSGGRIVASFLEWSGQLRR